MDELDNGVQSAGLAPGDPYIDWPYATAYLLNTLDPELIEGHANHILSRALNVGRTVAFLGAGVSMSYGRVSWRSLVNSQVESIRRKLAETIKYWRPAEGDREAFYAAHGHLDRLTRVLDELEGKAGLDVQADRYPMMFQLCEQLDKALELVRDTECDRDKLTASGRMREIAMDLTIDDKGHARETLLKAFEATFSNIDTQTDERKKQRARLTKRANCLAPYTAPAFGALISSLNDEGGWEGAEGLKAVAMRLLEERKGERFLLPTQRYLVGAVSRLTRSDQPVGWWAKMLSEDGPTESPEDKEDKWVPEDPGKPRRQELSPPRRDPLMSLLERLQINRFITTNYDHEIERLFRDRLFRDRGENAVPASLLRPASEWIVFDNDNATRLMTFAVQDRGRQGKVVYLHGRAGPKPDSRIIVTETDYQQHYLSPGEHRDMADDAIRLAFGGNPLLFVGSNMGEDDILRPLRQFMSAPSRVGDRVAIALVPAMTSRRKRVEEKIAHLGRYGVYTIHFGAAALADKIERGGRDNWTLAEADAHSVEWLPWIWAIRESLQKRLVAVESACAKVLGESLSDADRFAQFARDCEKLGGDHARYRAELTEQLESGLERTPSAERATCKPKEGVACSSGLLSAEGKLVPPNCLEGARAEVEQGLCVGIDVEILNACIGWLDGLPQRLGNLKDAAADEVQRDRLRQQVRRLGVEATSHRLALEGAADSILSIFTCARLMRAHWQWDDWKRNWFKLPQPRDPMFTRSEKDGVLYEHRHKIERPDRPAVDPPAGRFYDGAPAHSFYGLVAALGSETAKELRTVNERRILIIAGRRGVGKGHFFNALESVNPIDDGDMPKFRQFLKAFGPDQTWHAAGFYNLSFAHEVMSVFDGISNFLHDAIGRLDVSGDSAPRAFDSYRSDRSLRLESAMSEWTELAKRTEVAARKRVLIAINSIGMLFDRAGEPKNGQVKRLFNTLLDERFKSAPIDILFVCQDTNLPVNFRGGLGREGIRPLILPRPTDDPKSASAADNLYRSMGIELTEAAEAEDSARQMDIDWRSPGEARLGSPWKSARVTVSAERPALPEVSGCVAIHLLHETRASVIATAYFPRVALLLARQTLRDYPALRDFMEPHDAQGDGPLPDIFEPHAVRFRNAVRNLLNRLLPDELENGGGRLAPKILFPAAIVLTWLLVETNDFDGTNGLEPRFSGLVHHLRELAGSKRREVDQAVIKALISPPTAAAHMVAARLGKMGSGPWTPEDMRPLVEDALKDLQLLDFRAFASADASLAPPYKPGDLVQELVAALGDFDRRMQSLHQAVGGSRMLMTLLMVGAYEITTSLTAGGSRLEVPTRRAVKQVAERVERYFDRSVLALRGVPNQRRSDIVIDTVVSLLRRHHDRGARLPLDLNAPVAKDGKTDTATPEQFELMMEVIWHLSVIGQPVEADVLAWCPRIQAACRKLDEKAFFDDEKYRLCVREILKLAVNRCLVFRLAPEGAVASSRDGAPGSEDGGVNNRLRYSVHRQIQRYVFEKLGAPSVEFTEADQFTLSLFATQPDDLPRLGRDAHKELSHVIEALSGYPGAQDRATRFRKADAGLKPRLLRAAFGIMRSVYSVAVLARCSESAAESDGEPGHEGYFEEHRRRVRWLIRAAVEASFDGSHRWDEPAESERIHANSRPPSSDSTDARPPWEKSAHMTSEKGAAAPFYAEEVVWLYNECAVLSLVQGKLSDAQALLDTAIAAAKKIEPDDSGALHVRLRLNRAVVDIERGQAAHAKPFLERIANTVGEHPIPPMIARGYLGLIAHLAGEVDTALAHYDRAIIDLTAHRRSRGASIFSRHRGDLLRNLQTPRVEEARQAIENALNLAQAGAHEDIRHMAVLSLVKHRLDHAGPSERPDLHLQLDNVERYARSVGMPRLLCDANLLRASLLLTQGETRLASSLVARALEIASMNDLRLYKIKALLLLSKITRLRGLPGAAQPLYDLGERMAKSAGSHFVLSYAGGHMAQEPV